MIKDERNKMVKCFFDTGVLKLDFLRRGGIERFNSKNLEVITPFLSLYVKEEFIHKLCGRVFDKDIKKAWV